MVTIEISKTELGHSQTVEVEVTGNGMGGYRVEAWEPETGRDVELDCDERQLALVAWFCRGEARR